MKKLKNYKQQARRNKHIDNSVNTNQSLQWIDKEDIFSTVPANENAFFVLLDGIQDPHNLGAIIRTAEAAGVHAIILPKNKTCPITETVKRISVGACFHIPFIRITNIASFIKDLQVANVAVYGATDHGSCSLYELDCSLPVMIVIGSEEKGMRALTEKSCDSNFFLPMLGQTPCLNASVAAGITLYEIVRQRI